MATSTPAPSAPGTLAAPAATGDPSSQTVRRPRHFPCFDGLRAIAALSVVALHTAWQSGFTLRSALGAYTSRLDIGVSVFFLISGFLLYRPFAASHLSGRDAPSTGRFYVRRLLRIVPAYWLALTFLTYALHVVKLAGWQSVLSHYFFVQIYIPNQIFTGIGPAWSLCTEMSFYLFLPLYAAVVARGRADPARQLQRELVGLGVLVAVSYGFRTWAFNQPGCTHACTFANPALTSTMADWLPSYLDLFALGMLLAVASSWFTLTDSEPAWLRHRALPWASWAAAAVTFIVVSNLGLNRNVIAIIPPGPDIGRQALYGLFAFFLLLPAVFGDQDRGAIRQLLRWWPLASIGVVSYGVYLWHQGWMTQWIRWKAVDVRGSWPALFIPVVALAIISATVSYFVVERPILRLKDHLGWWRRPQAPPGADGNPTLRVRDA